MGRRNLKKQIQELSKSLTSIKEEMQLLRSSIDNTLNKAQELIPPKEEETVSAANVMNTYAVSSTSSIAVCIVIYTIISIRYHFKFYHDIYLGIEAAMYIMADLISKCIGFIIAIVALEVTINSNKGTTMIKSYTDNAELFEVDAAITSYAFSLVILLAYGNDISNEVNLMILPIAYYLIFILLAISLIIGYLIKFRKKVSLARKIHPIIFPINRLKMFSKKIIFKAKNYFEID